MIHIVLYQPEKPANAGNIIRTCACFGLKLHFIGPLTFNIDKDSLKNKDYLKRASMDYIDDIDFEYYDNWDSFYCKHYNGNFLFSTRYGTKSLDEVKINLTDDLYFVFGRESKGIPFDILKKHPNDCFRLPMVKEARSLNLSNCVAICAYEALRQNDFVGLSKKEFLKGEDYLNKV